jgi:hypothetical protein
MNNGKGLWKNVFVILYLHYAPLFACATFGSATLNDMILYV